MELAFSPLGNPTDPAASQKNLHLYYNTTLKKSQKGSATVARTVIECLLPFRIGVAGYD
jgi:hypothetical protein